jgi:hypothetical protein
VKPYTRVLELASQECYASKQDQGCMKLTKWETSTRLWPRSHLKVLNQCSESWALLLSDDSVRTE